MTALKQCQQYVNGRDRHVDEGAYLPSEMEIARWKLRIKSDNLEAMRTSHAWNAKDAPPPTRLVGRRALSNRQGIPRKTTRSDSKELANKIYLRLDDATFSAVKDLAEQANVKPTEWVRAVVMRAVK